MGIGAVIGIIAAIGGQTLYGPIEAFSQGRPARYQVQHADPYLIVMLLTGQSPRMPEISTAAMFFGMPQQQQGGNWLIPEGTLIVNPADNSIWYVPKKR